MTGLAALGAGAVLPRLEAGFETRRASPDSPSTWALLSDTHIHESEKEENRRFNMAKNLRQAVEEVAALEPDGVMINGDLARLTGNPGDYRTCLSLLKPLGEKKLPVHLTLGNHDHRGHLIEAVREGRGEAVEGKWTAAAVVDGRHWLFLDSLDQVNQVPGTLGRKQLAWLEHRLEAAPRLPALICLHHNPERGGIGLTDTEALLNLLIPLPQVKAVFFGHTHTFRRWELAGIHLINLPAVGYNFEDREPVGWVLASFSTEGMEMELRSLDGKHPAHGKKEALKWRSRAPRRLRLF